MKKFIAILTAIFFVVLIPISVAKAEDLTKEQKAQYKSQVKYSRNIIKQNAAEIKKLELKIDDSSDKLGKIIMMLYSREMPPSADKLSQIENAQETILKDAEQIVHVERGIRRLKKEAAANVDEESYPLALDNFDKIIALQGKEKEILEAFNKDTLDFIDLIKSTKNK